MAPETRCLMICTVGGSPEPLVASIRRWRPARIEFVPSNETVKDICENIVAGATDAGFRLPEGCFDAHPVADAQDFGGCVATCRRLSEKVSRWLERSRAHYVVVDFTGGTKCMTAALALQAHRWRCTFSYVGGTERTKGGVGIVVSGREQVVRAENPWNALGYQAVEDAIVLLNRGFWAVATAHLERTMRAVSDLAAKRELATLKSFTEAYAAWDRFEHERARDLLNNAKKGRNDFIALFGDTGGRRLTEDLNRHAQHLSGIVEENGPRRVLVIDLVANAARRADEGRYDDAVARLYRAVEALAQSRLKEGYGIDSDRVPVERLPPQLHRKLAEAEDGSVKLGLQDDYTLLYELGDPVGTRFYGLNWQDARRSPLSGRNGSILAHGFRPIGNGVYRQLKEGISSLAELSEQELPRFPRLSEAD